MWWWCSSSCADERGWRRTIQHLKALQWASLPLEVGISAESLPLIWEHPTQLSYNPFQTVAATLATSNFPLHKYSSTLRTRRRYPAMHLPTCKQSPSPRAPPKKQAKTRPLGQRDRDRDRDQSLRLLALTRASTYGWSTSKAGWTDRPIIGGTSRDPSQIFGAVLIQTWVVKDIAKSPTSFIVGNC